MKLLKERDALKSEVNAKSGEIAIVRSKNEQITKEAERKAEALRKLHADKEAKWQREIESTRIAEKNAATERDFVKQDLAEEAERVRRMKRAQEADKKGANVTTPKKKRQLPHRDGFDDDEVEVLSPSKISPSRFQRRLAGSPSKASGKRKRKTVESPVGALEVTNAEEPIVEKPTHQDMILDDSIIESLGKQDDRFDVSDNVHVSFSFSAEISSFWEQCLGIESIQIIPEQYKNWRNMRYHRPLMNPSNQFYLEKYQLLDSRSPKRIFQSTFASS